MRICERKDLIPGDSKKLASRYISEIKWILYLNTENSYGSCL